MLTFSHPDYTVGPGIQPDLHRPFRSALAGSAPITGHTAGRELFLAERTLPRRWNCMWNCTKY